MPTTPSLPSVTEDLQSAFRHPLYGYRSIPDALLTPVEFNAEKENRTYTGAIYSQRGNLIIDSVRPAGRGFRPVDPVTIDRSEVALHDAIKLPRGIFGGQFFFAWGHLIIETLSSAASFNDNNSPKLPLVFQSWWPFTLDDEWKRKFVDHSLPLLRAAWGERDFLITTKPVLFGEVIIPARLATIRRPPVFHPTMNRVYDRIRAALGSACETDKTVLVMRPDSHGRRHPVESELYRLSAQSEFRAETILPHTIRVEEQIELYSKTKILIGFSGSNLHNSLFMPQGTTVVEIVDNENPGPNSNQIGICKLRNQEIIHVSGFASGSPRSATEILKEITEKLESSSNFVSLQGSR